MGGGLINFTLLKRGGLLEGGGLFERGGEGFNRGFTVFYFNDKEIKIKIMIMIINAQSLKIVHVVQHAVR